MWYFGEGSEDLTEGRVSGLAGSLESRREQRQAGHCDGSSSGSWRRLSAEFLLGTAEDFASVLSLDEKVTGPLGSLTIAPGPKR